MSISYPRDSLYHPRILFARTILSGGDTFGRIIYFATPATSETGVQQSTRYLRAFSRKQRCTVTFSLWLIRSVTSSQRRSLCSKDDMEGYSNQSWSPPLHLTTSKVMVIVWRLRVNIIRTVLYIANVLPLQSAQLTKTVHTARLGLEFVFVFFGLHDLSVCWCMFCFTLDSWVISLHVLALA